MQHYRINCECAHTHTWGVINQLLIVAINLNRGGGLSNKSCCCCCVYRDGSRGQKSADDPVIARERFRSILIPLWWKGIIIQTPSSSSSSDCWIQWDGKGDEARNRWIDSLKWMALSGAFDRFHWSAWSSSTDRLFRLATPDRDRRSSKGILKGKKKNNGKAGLWLHVPLFATITRQKKSKKIDQLLLMFARSRRDWMAS